MRLVPKQIESYKNDRLIEEVDIKNVPDVEMIYNIVSEKDKIKTVKTCERMIRSSLEYKDYIKFLKDYIDMTKCSFFGNSKMDHYSKFKVEIHHSPFTLYDITMTVLLKHLDYYGQINLFEVCEEVMKLHYQCKVGLIPFLLKARASPTSGAIPIPPATSNGFIFSLIVNPFPRPTKVSISIPFSNVDKSLVPCPKTLYKISTYVSLNLHTEIGRLR